MTDAAELIRAFAALLWPVVVLVLLLAYRPEIQRLLARLRRGKLLGQELEFDRALDELEQSASAAKRQTADARSALPPAEPPTEEAVDQRQARPRASAPVRDDIDAILADASISPKLALVALSAELEKTMRRILAASQPPENWERQSLPQLVRRIELPPSLRAAVTQFYSVRNRIVHGHDVEADDAIRAVDSGIKILDAIRAIPHEVHIVRVPSIAIYADEAATTALDVTAVILETKTSDGDVRRDVFPTRREYQPGQILTWEWDYSSTWPEAWYRDPETAEIRKAWDWSVEFAGRPMDEVA